MQTAMALTATNCKHTLPLLCTEEYLQPRRPMLPHVSPAGERPTSRTAKPADTGTTASCLSFAERPQTPPHEKKYRQSALHEPGAIVRHFGTAEDALPEGTFGRATHAKPGESVADYIQSYPQSALKQWALQQAEDVYARYTGDLCSLFCLVFATPVCGNQCAAQSFHARNCSLMLLRLGFARCLALELKLNVVFGGMQLKA